MFLINKKTKEAQKIKDVTFKECDLKERQDIQEWIKENPSLLGEELLIIQKEFSQFKETNERLDLLALDKNGNLVIIENKLDDSGKDVVWQAMKYASYCSILTKENVREIFQDYLEKERIDKNAEQTICDFLAKTDFSEVEINDDMSQRIILVAREFRREVTSTVIWARKFNIDIKCIKLTPYLVGEQLIVDTDQIIPLKDIEEITVSYDNKAKVALEDRKKLAQKVMVRDAFFHRLLERMNRVSNLFSGRSLENQYTDSWVSAGCGYRDAVYCFCINNHSVSVELSIAKIKDQTGNKKIFDYFYQHRKEIEESFGDTLEWRRADDKIQSQISYHLEGADITNQEDWESYIEFLTENMCRFEKALKPWIEKMKKELK